MTGDLLRSCLSAYADLEVLHTGRRTGPPRHGAPGHRDHVPHHDAAGEHRAAFRRLQRAGAGRAELSAWLRVAHGLLDAPGQRRVPGVTARVWVSSAEAAAVVGAGESTVRSWAQRGAVQSRQKPGHAGHRQVHLADCRRYAREAA